PGLDKCCEDIRDRQQSDQIGNLRGRQSIRIAGAIKIFVMMPHAIQNFRTDARYALQQIISDPGMTPDDLLLLGVEASWLVQDRQRDARLPDVVEGRRHSEPRDVPAGESDIQPKGDCNTGHKQAVLKRTLMIAAHLVEPRRKPVLPDAIDDLRRRTLRIDKLQWPATAHIRKHRGEGYYTFVHLRCRICSAVFRGRIRLFDLRNLENGFLGA